MGTGRTSLKHCRFYADGYDLSGDARDFGPLNWSFEGEAMAGLNWDVVGSLLGQAEIQIGMLNGIFNSDSDALHEVMNAANAERVVLAPIGIRAAPAAGDPAFCGKFAQKNYMGVPGSVMVTASMEFDKQYPASLNYGIPWGVLLHAKGNETGVNSGTGVDGVAATTEGGFMIYQIFSVTGASGSVVISVDDSANNSDFLALSGATSGSISKASVPCAGIVQLGVTATVRRYLRWQIALTTLTGVNFALAFVRGRGV